MLMGSERNRIGILLGLIFFLGIGSVQAAETAKETFESLFGTEAAAAKKSASKRDDAELVKRIWTATNEMDDSPKVQAYFCERVLDFAKSGKDYVTANKALNKLETIWPESNLLQERLAIARLIYSCTHKKEKLEAASNLLSLIVLVGDMHFEQIDYAEAMKLYGEALRMAKAMRLPAMADINDKLQASQAEARREKIVQSCKAKLKARPTDTASAKRLAMIYLLERDDPASAAPYMQEAGLGKTFQDNTLLASTKDIPLAAHYTLGVWYQTLAKGPFRNASNATGKALAELTALKRAHRHLAHFIEKKDKGRERLKAGVLLGLVDAKLRKLVLKLGKPIDLMLFVDLTKKKNIPAGTWTRQGDTLCEKAPQVRYRYIRSLLAIPVHPKGNYILSFTVKPGEKVSSGYTEEVMALIPVDLIIANAAIRTGPWGNGEEEREKSYRRYSTNRPLRYPVSFEKGKKHRVDISVRYFTKNKVEIVIYVNNQKTWYQKCLTRYVRKPYNTPVREKCIHLYCPSRRGNEYSNLKLRMLSGKAEFLDE